MEALLDLKMVREHLDKVMMPHELEEAMPLIEEIRRLKKEKNAVILGHNYMTPDVFYGVSDFVGDSLGLSREAARSNADLILFNGVHFMAETAKVLNPDRKVLIADADAGCSLAESISASDVRKLKEQHPDALAVCYVNCSAAVKAECYSCCTSANAAQVVNSVPGDKVIFIPDEYLARNVRQETKKEIISWEKGKCLVHEQYRPEDLDAARLQFDDLAIIAHPECDTDVTGAADFSGSTSQMEEFIRNSPRQNIMLVTECSMGDNLRSVFSDRHFISSCHVCPYMKMITLKKVLISLEKEIFEVNVPLAIIGPAREAVERMLALS